MDYTGLIVSVVLFVLMCFALWFVVVLFNPYRFNGGKLFAGRRK